MFANIVNVLKIDNLVTDLVNVFQSENFSSDLVNVRSQKFLKRGGFIKTKSQIHQKILKKGGGFIKTGVFNKQDKVYAFALHLLGSQIQLIAKPQCRRL